MVRSSMVIVAYGVWYFWGRVTNFNQLEAGKQCFLASDWLKFETLPLKYRTLYLIELHHNTWLDSEFHKCCENANLPEANRFIAT